MPEYEIDRKLGMASVYASSGYHTALDTAFFPLTQCGKKANEIHVASIPDQVTWPDLSSMIGLQLVFHVVPEP